MKNYPDEWNEQQRQRFQSISDLLGIEGLWDSGRFIHVAGTNGKGSVCAFLSAILRKAGYSVGMFISPHLYRPEERISIDGMNIDSRSLDELMAEARDGQCSEFEQYMYAALKYFQAKGTDINIIEAGIGGSMDCTSIVHPMMCVCAAIGLDHTQLLGDSLADITRQKAGIAKPGVPFVVYPDLDAQARDALLAECDRQQAIVFDMASGELHSKVDGELLQLSMSVDGLELQDVPIGLRGEYQAINGAAAAYAAWLLNACGLMVKPADIVYGLAAVVWPGRMQVIPGKPDLLLDGAHNPQAAAALRQAVGQYFPDRNIVLLTAIMKDKQYRQVAAELAGITDRVVCTCVDPQRGLPAAEYAKLFDNAQYDDDPQAALETARQLAGEDGLVVVCGSLHLPGLLQSDQ